MKRLFYFGIVTLIAFEMGRVYFIMPTPGSQEGDFLGLAFFMHQWRWVIRLVLAAVILSGAKHAFAGRWYVPTAFALGGGTLVYLLNFVFSADGMFLQPHTIHMMPKSQNTVAMDKLVMGVEYKGEAKAYPIQLLAYHHQVIDTFAGEPLMLTYCSVCRTGRVYLPRVNGKNTTFRLVGMDHYNAMFEDNETGSWWRQGTGEAVAGSLKGQMLPELSADHTTLETWLSLHPNSTIMQPDPDFLEEYAALEHYDIGQGGSALTKTDSADWGEKSWVVGILAGNAAKAFSWKRLREVRLVEERVGTQNVLLVMAADGQSFFAFERPDTLRGFQLKGDTLKAGQQQFNLEGHNRLGGASLHPVKAYQEFWHSWRTFHPGTEKW